MLDKTVIATKATEIQTRSVMLRGLTDIMFDRYPGDNNTKLEPWQKLYLEPGGSRVIGLPALNIMSFLSAHNTNSAPKRLRDKRKYKDLANAMLSFVSIREQFIPLLRNNAPIVFGKFDGDRDAVSGAYVAYHVARLDKGVPNPKVRPVVPLDWAVRFTVDIFPNRGDQGNRHHQPDGRRRASHWPRDFPRRVRQVPHRRVERDQELKFGVAGLGQARRGAAGHGVVRPGWARRGTAGHGMVGPGKARRGNKSCASH
jgi:hypothetical protein